MLDKQALFKLLLKTPVDFRATEFIERINSSFSCIINNYYIT